MPPRSSSTSRSACTTPRWPLGARVRRIPCDRPHAVRDGAAGCPGRPGPDGVTRLQRPAPPHAGVHPGGVRGRSCRRAQHLVERTDRSDLDRHRPGARPVHHRRDRRHHASRRRLARCVRVRRCQHLPARHPARRSSRRSVRGPPAGRGTVQHRHRRAAPGDHGGLPRWPRRHHRPSPQTPVAVGRPSDHPDGSSPRQSTDASSAPSAVDRVAWSNHRSDHDVRIRRSHQCNTPTTGGTHHEIHENTEGIRCRLRVVARRRSVRQR